MSGLAIFYSLFRCLMLVLRLFFTHFLSRDRSRDSLTYGKLSSKQRLILFSKEL